MNPQATPVVLIVEENPNTLDTLIACVRESGWNIELSARAATARRQVERALPRMVILSRELPDADGIELVAEWAQATRTRDLPVVMLSNRATPEAMAQALDAGAVDYLAKPFDNEELKARLRRHLALNDRLREVQNSISDALRAAA